MRFGIPPLIGRDAVAITVSAGEEGGVAWRSPRIGVVVIAVWKVRAMIEEDAKSGVAELVMIAIQIVAAELASITMTTTSLGCPL